VITETWITCSEISVSYSQVQVQRALPRKLIGFTFPEFAHYMFDINLLCIVTIREFLGIWILIVQVGFFFV
jgi:hypothetical protein